MPSLCTPLPQSPPFPDTPLLDDTSDASVAVAALPRSPTNLTNLPLFTFQIVSNLTLCVPAGVW